MSTWNEEEDGMGFAGLLPTRAEREHDKALTAAYAEGRRDEQQELSSVLPGSYYMDPPDGGSVTVLEQLQRMAEDARKWRERGTPADTPCGCRLGECESKTGCTCRMAKEIANGEQ